MQLRDRPVTAKLKGSIFSKADPAEPNDYVQTTSKVSKLNPKEVRYAMNGSKLPYGDSAPLAR